MTNEELQTIVAAVIQSLKTNGKTVAQLTEVQSIASSDYFEISGGRKVSYGVLLDLLSDAIAIAIDTEGITADIAKVVIQTVDFDVSGSTATLRIKQAGYNAKTVSLPVATDSQSGIITAADKVKLDRVYTTATRAEGKADAARAGMDALSAQVTRDVNTLIESYRPVVIEGDVSNAADEEDLTSSGGLLKFKDKVYAPTVYSGKGRVWLRKSVDAQGVCVLPALGAADTVYVVRYDHDLRGGTVVVPPGCELRFDGGSIIDSGRATGGDPEKPTLEYGGLVLDGTLLSGDVRLGCRVSGTCRNEQAWQGWFIAGDIDLWHRCVNDVDGPTVWHWSAGRWHATVPVSKEVSGHITLEGHGAVVVWDVGNESGSFTGISLSAPAAENSVRLLKSATQGENELIVESASGMSVGDWCCVYDAATSSFSPERQYQESEFFTIKAIESSTTEVNGEEVACHKLVVSHPLWGNYTHIGDDEPYNESSEHYEPTMEYVRSGDVIHTGPCWVTRFEMAQCRVRALGVEALNNEGGPTGRTGVRIVKCRAEVEGVQSVGFSRGMELVKCADSTVRDCATLSVMEPNGDGYGVCVLNCQGLLIEGGRYRGGNHGISLGGSYIDVTGAINRFICIVNTETQSTRAAFRNKGIGFHQNAEYCTVRDNRSSGIIISGKHHIIEGNRVFSVVSDSGAAISVDIASSLSHHIRGNTGVEIRLTGSQDSTYTHTWKHITVETGQEQLVIDCNDVYNLVFKQEIYPSLSNIGNTIVRLHGNNIKRRMRIIGYACKQMTESALSSGGTIELVGNLLNLGVRESDATNPKLNGFNLIAPRLILKDNTFTVANMVSTRATDEMVLVGNKLLSGNVYINGKYISGQSKLFARPPEVRIIECNRYAGGILYVGECEGEGDDCATVINASALKYGTASSRPTSLLTLRDEGFRYFNTSTKKGEYFTVNLATRIVNKAITHETRTSIESGVLTSGVVYKLTNTRPASSVIRVGFGTAEDVAAAVSEGLTDEEIAAAEAKLLMVYDNAKQGQEAFIAAPDLTVNTMIYLRNDATSNATIALWTIARGWVDANGEEVL